MLSEIDIIETTSLNKSKVDSVPPNGYKTGSKNRTKRTVGVTDALRSMAIGDKIDLPRKSWGTVGSCAKNIGIKIKTRSLGCKNKITVYRIK